MPRWSQKKDLDLCVPDEHEGDVVIIHDDDPHLPIGDETHQSIYSDTDLHSSRQAGNYQVLDIQSANAIRKEKSYNCFYDVFWMVAYVMYWLEATVILLLAYLHKDIGQDLMLWLLLILPLIGSVLYIRTNEKDIPKRRGRIPIIIGVWMAGFITLLGNRYLVRFWWMSDLSKLELPYYIYTSEFQTSYVKLIRNSEPVLSMGQCKSKKCFYPVLNSYVNTTSVSFKDLNQTMNICDSQMAYHHGNMVENDAGGHSALECHDRCLEEPDCAFWDWDGRSYCRLRRDPGYGPEPAPGHFYGARACSFIKENLHLCPVLNKFDLSEVVNTTFSYFCI
eukprot:UN23138